MKTVLLGLIMSFCTFFLISCDDTGAINLFTVEDDAALGKQLDSTIRATPSEYPLYTDSYANNYVQTIMNSIIASPLINYKGIFEYKVYIIKSDTVVNAFACPGGYIYVYTGLLKYIDDEATLAAVLAHEVAHAERRHTSQRMTQSYGIQFLLNIAFGGSPGDIESIAGNLFSNLYLLKNSRDDEYEADEYSFKYLQSTKWYAGAMTRFFSKIAGNESSSALTVLLSTHPLSEDRVAAVNELIKNAKLPEPTEGNLFSSEYAIFKGKLQ